LRIVDAQRLLLASVLNVTHCHGTVAAAGCCAAADAPIVLSQPHFNQADPSYQHAIDGLAPNDSYLTFLDVEPVSKQCCQCLQQSYVRNSLLFALCQG